MTEMTDKKKKKKCINFRVLFIYFILFYFVKENIIFWFLTIAAPEDILHVITTKDLWTPEHQSRQRLGQPCLTADRSDLWRLSDNEKSSSCLIVTLSSLSTGRSWILAHYCFFLRIVIRAFLYLPANLSAIQANGVIPGSLLLIFTLII